VKQPQSIRHYDHIGIRVSDRQQAVAFYEQLGFREMRRFDKYEANEMETPDGVRINLIFNATRVLHNRNILLDEPVKLPGVTHAAFVVDDLYALKGWLEQAGITITEGIHPIGPRRIALFIRDPDRNVLEFNQLLTETKIPFETPESVEVYPMKLYDLEVSGNCYKVRLFAALAGIELALEPVDFAAGAHKQSPLIDLNPWGEVPVLVDGDIVLRDSQAILVYLARQYGGHQWWPDGAAQQAEVMQWLSTAANEIQHGPNSARLIKKFGLPLDKESAMNVSTRVLQLIDRHLSSHNWLALGRPTIADCAVFPYVAVGWEGDVTLEQYPAIQAWVERIKALPGYIAMPGID
jgi:Glutathione S-transferase